MWGRITWYENDSRRASRLALLVFLPPLFTQQPRASFRCHSSPFSDSFRRGVLGSSAYTRYGLTRSAHLLLSMLGKGTTE
jgi:hypothetical protein